MQVGLTSVVSRSSATPHFGVPLWFLKQEGIPIKAGVELKEGYFSNPYLPSIPPRPPQKTKKSDSVDSPRTQIAPPVMTFPTVTTTVGTQTPPLNELRTIVAAAVQVKQLNTLLERWLVEQEERERSLLEALAAQTAAETALQFQTTTWQLRALKMDHERFDLRRNLDSREQKLDEWQQRQLNRLEWWRLRMLQYEGLLREAVVTTESAEWMALQAAMEAGRIALARAAGRGNVVTVFSRSRSSRHSYELNEEDAELQRRRFVAIESQLRGLLEDEQSAAWQLVSQHAQAAAEVDRMRKGMDDFLLAVPRYVQRLVLDLENASRENLLLRKEIDSLCIALQIQNQREDEDDEGEVVPFRMDSTIHLPLRAETGAKDTFMMPLRQKKGALSALNASGLLPLLGSRLLDMSVEAPASGGTSMQGRGKKGTPIRRVNTSGTESSAQQPGRGIGVVHLESCPFAVETDCPFHGKAWVQHHPRGMLFGILGEDTFAEEFRLRLDQEQLQEIRTRIAEEANVRSPPRKFNKNSSNGQKPAASPSHHAACCH
eukprot:TRINITY_DN97491_c0_g1_i1.p1 TRINITY_DN97491_c0_g1~~TRINITY_DN97491_c0_g1_i1.p1  ORF type:complete len:545 (+),score=78.87 TRINITY_DN97491_c0_g1_i1:57-1691(+)